MRPSGQQSDSARASKLFSGVSEGGRTAVGSAESTPTSTTPSAESNAAPVESAGDKIVSRQLDVQPTITVRPGARVRVLVSRDLILPCWPGAQGPEHTVAQGMGVFARPDRLEFEEGIRLAERHEGDVGARCCGGFPEDRDANADRDHLEQCAGRHRVLRDREPSLAQNSRQ